jgi:polyisoprenoid-binding protein YceI
MKTIIYPLLASIIFLGSAFVTITSAPEFKLKENYKFSFKSKDPSGEFTSVKGTVKFDENDLKSSSFELTFDINSISMGNNMKNKKAQTEEWFNASKFPTATYKSSSIEKSGDSYIVNGTFTMKGTSKELKVPMKVSKSGSDYTFSGNFDLNRIDYKVGKKNAAVPDIMNISYSLPVTKK